MVTNIDGVHLFGIAEGYGQNGNIISNLVKQQLPKILAKYMKREPYNLTLALKKSYQKLEKIVQKERNSGTTLCTVLLKGRTLVFANIGDSRAILISSPTKVV